MCDRSCDRCGKEFQFPSHLKVHQQRKTPCDLKVDPDVTAKYACQHCNRSFLTDTARCRHVRESCKVVKAAKVEAAEAAAKAEAAEAAAKAEAAEAAAKAEALARPAQVSTQIMAEIVKQNNDANVAMMTQMMAQMMAQMMKLVEQKQPLVEYQISEPPPTSTALAVQSREPKPVAPVSPKPSMVKTVTNSVVQNNNNVQNNITIQAAAVNITPWDSPDYITVSLADILAAFAENPKLRQYLHMDDFELSDFEKAPPYVIELFIELLLRAHLLEVARNVYLNPSRSDQVMVRMKSGSWDVAPLNDSIEHLFNGIARRLHVITITNEERTKLPYDIQNAISICEMMYRDHPDVYIKLAKEVIVAHLTNCRAKLIASGAVVQKTRK